MSKMCVPNLYAMFHRQNSFFIILHYKFRNLFLKEQKIGEIKKVVRGG